MRPRRRLAALLAAAALLAPSGAVATSADPLDPPEPDRWRIWLIDRVDAKPRVLRLPVRWTMKNGRSMIWSVGFHHHGKKRDFEDAQLTSFMLSARGGVHPRIYTDEHGDLLPCRYQVLCTEPEPEASTPWEWDFGAGPLPTTQSRYLIAVNIDTIQVSLPKGWRMRELPPRSINVHMIRKATGVVINPLVAVERFTRASVTAKRGPSIAWAAIPCLWGPAGPTGPGEAWLDGGGPVLPLYGDRDRNPTCDIARTGHLDVGRAANDRPTTWTLHGDSTGIMSGAFHLAVVELPSS